MKTLILLLITLSLSAQSSSIDEQIAQLQNADPQKRYELMNAIKIRISSMNSAERSAAISKLQKNRGVHVKGVSNNQQHHSANQMQDMNRQYRGQGGGNGQMHHGNGVNQNHNGYGNKQ